MDDMDTSEDLSASGQSPHNWEDKTYHANFRYIANRL